MASALIGGLGAQGLLREPPVVVEPLQEVREALRARFAVHAIESPDGSLTGCAALILAVKPQQMRAAVLSAAPYLGETLLISIAAGIPTASIARWAGRDLSIVRAMPNTPALIGEGITGLFANPAVDPRQRELAALLLGAVGATVWVGEEALLDAVTAISGSGPAYVFYLIEALERAGRELGLAPEAAHRLARATFSGAVRLAEASSEPLEVLRERVTSKGGTTQAALTELERQKVAEHIVGAARAAAIRAAEMGREFGQD
jgi:pyrroline-5-carboxylate reductase